MSTPAGASVLYQSTSRTLPRLSASPWTVVGAARIHPHYLAYFNQIAGGPRGGARYLLDSNIDWGQDLKGLADYLKKEDMPGPVYVGYFGHDAPKLYGI